MRKNIVIVVVVLLGVILSLFLGCQDDLIETLEKVQAHVEISVKLPEELKTPDFKPDDFIFSLNWFPVDDESDVTKEEFDYEENIGIVFQFAPGEYTFEIIAKDKNTGDLKASGRATTSILPGQRDQLEIPLTYYVFGGDSGFTVEDGVITLSGKLTFTSDQTITVPSDMKLVIEDGCIIEVGDGNTLTIDGVVEAEGDLTIAGDLDVTQKFTVDGDLAVEGNLKVSGTGDLQAKGEVTVGEDFTAEAGAKVVADNTLTVEKDTNIAGDVKVGSLIDPPAGVTDLTITISEGGILEVPRIADTYEKVTVSGGGTLKINSDTTLKEVVLNDDSVLEIGGALKDGSINESGIKISGEGTLAANTIDASTVDTASDKTLTIIGDVTLTEATGFGTVIVEGTLTADQLPIDNGATIEASSLEAKDGSVTVSGGGALKVNNNTYVDRLEIKDDSSVTIEGTLNSGTVTGKGSLSADSITTDTLTNTGNLEVNADSINTGKLELLDNATIAISGSVITEEIAGVGNLEVRGDVGATGDLTIKGEPTVSGDLNLEPDTTLYFDGKSTLEVTGDVKAWGDLTLTGDGKLDVGGDLTVAGDLIKGAGVDLDVDGETNTGTLPLGKKPDLALYIKPGETFTLESIEDGWESITVTGGGTLLIESVDTTLEKIILENGSIMEVTGDLMLSDNATLSLSEDSILMVLGDLESEGNLALSGAGRLDIEENLTVKGDFTANANIHIEKGLDVSGDLEIGKTVTVDSLSMGANKTLEITDDGSLEIMDSGVTEISKVVLGDGATMGVTGDLTSDEISGGGDLRASSIDVATIDTENGKTLTLNGDVTVKGVTGDGTAKVEGEVTVEDLSIASGATLEMASLKAEDDSVTISGGGELKINSDTSVDELELKDNSSITIEGDLTSVEITGTGSLTADSVTTETLSNTGNLTVNADSIVTEKIELKNNKNETLTLNGDVITDEVAGDGSLVVAGDVGATGDLTIKGSPTVTGDLNLEPDTTLVFEDNKTLEVTGDVNALGDLTLTGDGELKATNISVAETLINADPEVKLTVTGEVSAKSKIEGEKPDLKIYIKPGETLELDSIGEGWETITVSGGGTLNIKNNTTLEEIELKDGSKVEVDGTLKGENGTGVIVSGEGALTATSIEALTVSTENGKTLTLIGDVSVTEVTGDGTAKVEGKVTVEELSIELDATLEAASLEAKNGSVTISGGGVLKVNSDTEIEDILKIEDDSSVTIDGTLKSDTITGDGVLTAASIDVSTIDTVNGETLTLNSDVTTGKISGDGSLDTMKIVGAEGKLTITGSPTITEDLNLEPETTLSFEEGATLEVKGDVKAWGDLTLEGDGKVDVKGDLTVAGALTADASHKEVGGDENIGDLPLGKKPDLTIYIKEGEDFTLDSIEAGWETVTVTGGGTLIVKGIDDGVDPVGTTLEKITLENGSKMEVRGDLELSLGASLSFDRGASLTVRGEIEAKGDLTLSGEGKLNATNELTVLGNLSTESELNVTGELKVDGDAEIGGDASVGSLTIGVNKTLEIADDGSLDIKGAGVTEVHKVVLGNGATMDVNGELKSNEISGSGALTATNIDVSTINTVSGKTLTLDGPVSVGAVTGSGTAEVKGVVSVENLSITSGAILEAPSIAVVDNTIQLTGGGTLKVENAPILEKITFGNNSTLEVEDFLNIGDIEISGDGNLIATSIDIDKLSNSGNQTITAATINAEEIEVALGKTLTLNGDVTSEAISGAGSVKVLGEIEATDLSIGTGTTLDVSAGSLKVTGDVALAGTLDLGNAGWSSVNFGAQGAITLADDSADLKIKGVSKWYTLYDTKAKYSKVDNYIQLQFIIVDGVGEKKVTPAGTSKTPTEVITRVTSGVTFETPNNRNNFYLKVGDKFIVEDGGTFDAGAWWFGNFNSNLFKGSIIIKGDGNFLMSGGGTGRLAVGRNEVDKSWHSWAWKQDGTITEINKPDTQWKFTTTPEIGGNNKIDISYTGDVNTPIEIGEGVTATVSKKLKQNNSTLTIIGTVNVTGSLEIAQNNGIVFGAKNAGLIIESGGNFKHSTDTWLSAGGVKNNGFVQIEGGSFVTFGSYLWFGPTPSNPASQINLGTNIIVEIGDGLLTASKKDASINEGNVVSAKFIGTRMATPGVNILVKDGVQFNVADRFVSRGNLEVEGGGVFTIGIAGGYAVNSGKSLIINDGATFEILGNGKMMKLGSSSQYFGGTVDIKQGATVNVGGKTEPDKSATYSGKITYHTVKYNEVQVFKHQ